MTCKASFLLQAISSLRIARRFRTRPTTARSDAPPARAVHRRLSSPKGATSALPSESSPDKAPPARAGAVGADATPMPPPPALRPDERRTHSGPGLASGAASPPTTRSMSRSAMRCTSSASQGVRGSHAGLRLTSKSQGCRSSSIITSKPYNSKQVDRCTTVCCTASKQCRTMASTLGLNTSLQYPSRQPAARNSVSNPVRLTTAPSVTSFPCLFTAQFEMWRWRFDKSPKSNGSLHKRR
mmetsp:Transcript_75332/g.244979  ORF Transcript_75332/g.244979 Transcript_75332/m.244979 type:complete len:240 (+) Transcript_75332:1805-2524(+)